MEIARDGVGLAALLERGLAYRVVEAATAVADIEDHSALLGGERGRDQATVLHDIGEGTPAIGRACIGVRKDIARPQRVENLRHQLACFHTADVAHDFRAGAGPLAGRDRPL